MKKSYVIAIAAAALNATPVVVAQESGSPPARTAVIGTQRIGDLVVQSSVTPIWYIPSGVAVAVPGSVQNMMPPPSRAVVPPTAQHVPAVTAPAQAPVVVSPSAVVAQPANHDAVEQRKSSADWKQKIDALSGDLESNKLALVDAKAQLLVAAEEEKRRAEEQVAAAQRRLEASKKQATNAAAYAATLQAPAQALQVQTTPAPAKPVEVVVRAPTFTLRHQDRTIPAALTRWSEEAGYKLLWEAKEDPASFEGTYTKSFTDAVDDVIRDLRLAGRDLRMCEYTNKVIRIVPRSTPCQINPSTDITPVQIGATE